MVIVVVVEVAIGRGQLVEVFVVMVAHSELGDDVVQLVFAQHPEDFEVTLRMF